MPPSPEGSELKQSSPEILLTSSTQRLNCKYGFLEFTYCSLRPVKKPHLKIRKPKKRSLLKLGLLKLLWRLKDDETKIGSLSRHHHPATAMSGPFCSYLANPSIPSRNFECSATIACQFGRWFVWIKIQ